MDDEIESANSDAADLMRLIKVLRPLRQHRQAMAERRQRELQTHMNDTERHLEDARSTLATERSHQRSVREALSQAHSMRSLDRASIDDWQTDERKMLSHLADLQHGVRATQDTLTQLTTSLDSARMATKQRQRAVEKLGCLLEILEIPS